VSGNGNIGVDEAKNFLARQLGVGGFPGMMRVIRDSWPRHKDGPGAASRISHKKPILNRRPSARLGIGRAVIRTTAKNEQLQRYAINKTTPVFRRTLAHLLPILYRENKQLAGEREYGDSATNHVS
jgi:hypothetical protein